MTKLFTLLAAALVTTVSAQNYSIGTRTITFNDPARTGGTGSGGGPGRQIQTYLIYPSVTSGANTAVATGSFPVVVFGHGFSMTYDAYKPIYDSLASWGYVVCLPSTEGGTLSTSHPDFAQDLAIVLDKTLAFNTNNASPFIGKINGKGAIGGHSMGGGCSFLSAQFTTNETCLFNFAAAETTPSAVAQCSTTVDQPLLVIAGSYDVVAPPASNQDLMYNAAISACKTYVNITGAYHCQFSDVNLACQFGEGSLFPPSGGPSRDQQLATTRKVLRPFLDFWLKGICAQWTNFEALLTAGQGITSQQNCNVSIPTTPVIQTSGATTFCAGGSVDLSVSAGNSNVLWSNNQTTSSITASTNNTYAVTLTGTNNCSATSAPTTVTVNPAPNATIVPQGATSVCAPATVTLTSPSTTGNLWSTGQTTQTITITQTSNISLTVTDGNNCQATSQSVSVSIADSLVPPITGEFGAFFCQGTTAQLSLPDFSNYTSVLWSDNSTAQTTTANQIGQYCVSVTSSGCNGSNCITLTDGTPAANFTVTNLAPLLAGNVIDFAPNIFQGDPNSSVSWDYGDGTNGTANNHIYTSMGLFNACITVTDPQTGCSSIPYCSGFMIDGFVGIESNKPQTSFGIKPNPAQNTVTVFGIKKFPEQIILSDMSGRVVLESSLNTEMSTLNISQLKSGIYFLKSVKESKVLKLVVE